MSTDLIAWLRAQLDEDERIAGSATSGPWNNDDPIAPDGYLGDGEWRPR